MSENHRFPGAFVFRWENPNHTSLKENLLPKIIKKTDETMGDDDWGWNNQPSAVRSNWTLENKYPWNIFTQDDLEKIIFDAIRALLGSGEPVGPVPKSFNTKSIWWNRYPAGATAPPHTHSGSLSGVYILEQNEACPLFFHHSNQFGLDPDAGLGEEYNPPAVEGEVLLFPATLLHWVVPTKDWRTTISFNLGPVN
jgi:hypothetical protein